MPVSGCGFDQCYNAQASVDVETMSIVGRYLSQNPNDKLEIQPALENLGALPDALGTIDALLANTGYYSQANVDKCLEQELLPYISRSVTRTTRVSKSVSLSPRSYLRALMP